MRVSADIRNHLSEFQSAHGIRSVDAAIDALLQGKMYTTSPPNPSRRDEITPELQAVVDRCQEALNKVPNEELRLAALAIVYLRTLPEHRRLELVTMVLEHVWDEWGEQCAQTAAG